MVFLWFSYGFPMVFPQPHNGVLQRWLEMMQPDAVMPRSQDADGGAAPAEWAAAMPRFFFSRKNEKVGMARWEILQVFYKEKHGI